MNSDVARALYICLSLADNATELTAAVQEVGWAAIVEAAVNLRLGPALVARLRAKRAVPPIPAVKLSNGMLTVSASFEDIWSSHVERQALLRERLVELLVAMNAVGLEPILMKGARVFATGEPEWRSMRDIDLLVPGVDAERAHAVALSLGYRTAEGATEKAGKHHFQPLFRDDLPGWLEIHRKAAPFRAELFMPTALLDASTVAVTVGSARGRILSLPAHALHALVHHHVGHRGDKGGGIDLKGLFEFVADVGAMNESQRAETVAIASRHPRLLAMLDLWVAAAHSAFAMPTVAPLVLLEDARQRAERALGRATAPAGRYSGIWEEIGFANARERLMRIPAGSDAPGRLRLRLDTVSSMLRPMIDPTGD